MNQAEMRAYITTCVLSRFSRSGGRRDQALQEVLNLTVPGLDELMVKELAALVPELPFSLYERWVGMFADRLLETVQQAQLAELCEDSRESRATLMLLYAMFMESARMEKVVAEDLCALGNNGVSEHDKAALVAAWLRQRMTAAG